MTMTPPKRAARLSDTVRHLLHGAIESRWRPSLPAEELDAADRRRRARGAGAARGGHLAQPPRVPAHPRGPGPAHRRSARVVTGYKSSPAYTEFVRDYAGPLGNDDTFGYAVLLRVVFDELASTCPAYTGEVSPTWCRSPRPRSTSWWSGST